MRDDERLRKDIEEYRRKVQPVPASDDCELCGSWDTHLLEGVCPRCRARYKLNEVKS
jgi:uncharacterized paraquat-inducible protein A